MVPFFAAAAFAAAPSWPTLTPTEAATFAKGELVLRADTSTPLTDSTGIIHVNAPVDVLWRESLDFKAKVPENPSVKSLEEYARNSPDDWFVRFEMSFFGVHVVIHDHWTCVPAERVCTWVQDPDRESDVTGEQGYMIVRPDGTGSAITFHAQFVSKIWSPGWVRKWLANDNMVNVVEKLKARAERKAGSAG